MKRISAWFLSTVTLVVLMFGYHTSTSSVLSTTSPPAITSSGTGAAASSTGSNSGSGTSKSATSDKGAAHSVKGSVAQTQWGPVQVELTVSGGTITDVTVLQYPSGNSTDAQINSYALPVLIQETMDAQNAQIDMVSGATVTSVGYLQSLQSALDQAGL